MSTIAYKRPTPLLMKNVDNPGIYTQLSSDKNTRCSKIFEEKVTTSSHTLVTLLRRPRFAVKSTSPSIPLAILDVSL